MEELLLLGGGEAGRGDLGGDDKVGARTAGGATASLRRFRAVWSSNTPRTTIINASTRSRII